MPWAYGPCWVQFLGEDEPVIVDFVSPVTARLSDGRVVDWNILTDGVRVGTRLADLDKVWPIAKPDGGVVVELRYLVTVPQSVLDEHGREAGRGAARAALIRHLGGKLMGKARSRPDYMNQAWHRGYAVKGV